MAIRIETRIEAYAEHTEYTILLESDERLPFEDTVPWTETYRQLARDFAPAARQPFRQSRATVINKP